MPSKGSEILRLRLDEKQIKIFIFIVVITYLKKKYIFSVEQKEDRFSFFI